MDSIVKDVLNHIFDVRVKLEKLAIRDIDRNLGKLEQKMNASGYSYHSPIGEAFSEGRSDCEATIVGGSVDKLKVVNVIKPIIYKENSGQKSIIQRGVVLLEGEK